MAEEIQKAPEAKPSEEAKTSDNRTEEVRLKMVDLLNSAQGIWKDALQSQIALTSKADLLQDQINEIKDCSGLPSYPNGMRLLQQSLARIQQTKKRLASVSSRLSRLDSVIKAQSAPR